MNKHQNSATKKRLAILLVGLTMAAPQAGSLPEALQNTSFGIASAQADPRDRDNDRDRKDWDHDNDRDRNDRDRYKDNDRDRYKDRDRNRDRDRDRKDRVTVRAEVVSDPDGSKFVGRINGKSYNVVTRGNRPDGLRRGRDVELYGYWYNGAFVAERITVERNNDRNNRNRRDRR